MYQLLTVYHSIFNWLVLMSILYSIWLAYQSKIAGLSFSDYPVKVFRCSFGLTLIQLAIGLLIYRKSHITGNFWRDQLYFNDMEGFFFSIVHSVLMTIATAIMFTAVVPTRKSNPKGKQYNKIIIYFSIALIIMLLSVPWPFSPFIKRPYMR